MLCYTPLLGEKFTYMDKLSEKEIEEMTQFTFQRIIEIGEYIDNHHCSNALAIKTFAVAVAYLFNPPKGTEELFAESFKNEILDNYKKVREFKKLLNNIQ